VKQAIKAKKRASLGVRGVSGLTRNY